MDDRATFYQGHLDQVSRSFAFCIARLQGSLRERVGLAYLICRVLDTVEDAAWPSESEQSLQFEGFERLLTEPFAPGEVAEWSARFPSDLPEGEASLLVDAGVLFADLQALEPAARDSIQEPVLSMCRGMRHFASRRSGGRLILASIADVNQYCFFVAGVVGEALTRLVFIDRAGAVDERALVDSFHFGLFLQKINLLKDQAQDERSGRFLVPSRGDLIASLAEHAHRAIEYVTALPERYLGYRLFCSWSLFLGLASLPFIEKSFREKNDMVKIPRAQTRRLLEEIESVVGDNSRLTQLFDLACAASGVAEARPAVVRESAAPKNPVKSALESPPRAPAARALYRGLLPDHQLRAFGFV